MKSPGQQTFILHYTRPVQMVSATVNGQLYHIRDAAKEPNTKQFETIKINAVPSGDYVFYPKPDKVEVKPIEKKKINTNILPQKERSRFKKYTIITNEYLSGTPARNYTQIGEIQVSPSFHKLPLQIQKFILLHEIGHFFYETEWKCDLFALVHFINLGYNESNAFFALKNILSHSEENLKRIDILYNNILKQH